MPARLRKHELVHAIAAVRNERLAASPDLHPPRAAMADRTTHTHSRQAAASYKKKTGVLLLDGATAKLTWTETGQEKPTVVVPYRSVAALFVSKDGAPQSKLRVSITDAAGNKDDVNFTFTNASSAVSDKEQFKADLTQIVASNRAAEAANKADVPPSGAGTPVSGARTAETPRPTASAGVTGAGATPALTSTTTSARDTPEAGRSGVDNRHLKRKLLKENKELGALFKELVMGKQITEAEFWEGRENLIRAELVQESQKKGRSAQLVDPQITTAENGEVRLKITPQLVHDIFEQYPNVQRAYDENVPNELSEEEFWQRYFRSKLFNRNRTSVRAAASHHIIRDDPIFDRYLEAEDDELEPRHAVGETHDRLLDLGATEEDHQETGNRRDWTMQAGGQRKTLPLMRRFNDHSARLLDSALGQYVKRRRVDDCVDGQVDQNDPAGYYPSIVIDDLEDSVQIDRILLEMRDQQRYFEGGAGSKQGSRGRRERSKEEVEQLLEKTQEEFVHWELDLGNFRPAAKGVEQAWREMLVNVKIKSQMKKSKDTLPADLQQPLSTFHATTTEFLRQYWSATLPPEPDQLMTPASAATPKQKDAKAKRMIASLEKTGERKRALREAAEGMGIAGERVEEALAPTMAAVKKAIDLYYSTHKR